MVLCGLYRMRLGHTGVVSAEIAHNFDAKRFDKVKLQLQLVVFHKLGYIERV